MLIFMFWKQAVYFYVLEIAIDIILESNKYIYMYFDSSQFI
jgi:hypothetical protein